MVRWEYTETELWRHGDGDIALFHVFGLISIQNTVLCFAEARYGNGGDAGCLHDLWMRKSVDGGRSFAPSVCLCPNEGVRSWTNPVPVYDEDTGRLFLFYSDNPENLRTENFYRFSDDLGESWSAPTDITEMLNRAAAPLPFHLAGPGHGTQLRGGARAGRLIVPFWHRYGVDRPLEQRGYCVSMLYSDDHGATWSATETMGQDFLANESRIAQTQHDLVWIIRPGLNNPGRYVSRSSDDGETWSKPEHLPVGPANNCDGGVMTCSGKPGWEDVLCFSRISWTEKRRDMEVLYSLDGGRSFAGRMALPAGDAMPGYSDLCRLEDDAPLLGLLHCRNNHVLFSRISLEALTAGRYDGSSRKVWLG